MSAALSDHAGAARSPGTSLHVRSGSTRDATRWPMRLWMVGPLRVSALCFQIPKSLSPFSLFSIASFAPISFAIKAKENDLLPLEKNRVKLDDDSDDDEEGQEGQESSSSAMNTNPAVTPPCVVVEEKRPQLTQEELEAKQAKQKLEDRLAAAAREKLAQASKESKEKQLQAERKRKAALFLQTLKNPLPEAEVGKVEENPFSVEVS